MIPTDYKITNFSLYLFVCFLGDYHNYFWHAPSYYLVENLLASTLHIHSFSAHYTSL